MLNSLLNDKHHAVGFGGAVRASAGMVAGCLVLACAVIRKERPQNRFASGAVDTEARTELGPTEKKVGSRTEMSWKEAIKRLAYDPPYVLMMIA